MSKIENSCTSTNFSPKKLTVGKTISTMKNGIREGYYCKVETEVLDQDSLSSAEQYTSNIVDSILEKYQKKLTPPILATTDEYFFEDLDLEKIVWKAAKGTRGPFERSVDRQNPEFLKMVRLLKENRGYWSYKGLFYWLFRDGVTIGRKPVKHRDKPLN
jgi:hypothetical protein